MAAFAEPVRVGKYPAKVVPEQVVPLTLNGKGVLTDLVDTSQRIEAGTVVGILNKEQTETEREDMELALEREVLSKHDEMRKLRVQRHKVEFFLKLSPAERRYAADKGEANEIEMTRETLQDIDARINLLKRETATAQRRKRHEFDTKHDELTVRMPFAGRLQYNITVPEDLSQPVDYTTGVRQGFAVACDDSAYYITLAINNGALTQLPEENFSVTLPLPRGKELRGTYSHRKVERSNGGGDLLVYFFKLPEADREVAYSLMGSNANAILYFDAGADVQTVSKAELVADPRASQCEDWDQLVQTVYPGCSIVIVCERSIIISKN